MASGIVGEYRALERETDADLLAMQMGDFYEFFGDAARLASEELDLKISKRTAGGERYEMAGVPVDELRPYLRALVERGYSVAVADQHEGSDGDPEREVGRVVTPGTLLDPAGDDARYLAAVVRESDGRLGLSFLDVSTGRFHVTAVGDADAAVAELARFGPTEFLPGPEVRTDDALLGRVREVVDASHTLHDTEAFAQGRAAHAVAEQFGEAADGLGLDDVATRAAGAALDYVASTGAGALASVTRLGAYRPDDHVTLDATTRRNLELTEPMAGDGDDGSLLATLDHTETAAGGRLLAEWLGRPLQDRAELSDRQDAVAALSADAMARDRVRETLAGAYDVERLASRAAAGSADAGDLARLRDTLGLLPELREAVAASTELADSPVADRLEAVDDATVADCHAELADALVDDPPAATAGTGIVARGYDDDLDEVVERHEAVREWLDGLADREKRRHGLTHVTVDRTKTDGYYIQVGKSEADQVPDDYESIKTLKNSERFVTDELREREREVLRLEERRAEREAALFADLRQSVGERADRLQAVGRALAELDVLAALAHHAARQDWCRPALSDGDALHVEAGRHPVVERTTEFVPNDLHLDRDRRFLVVTGPNMSGKSTYLRQAALVTLLAQVGSFVPADAAEVGLVDGIYTRVGAMDELAQGRSTFMVEMQELSNILHSATDESLVILDEVGRGTATYDGISIAWAATEYLHNEVAAKTLFATHYHELTTLADHLERVENVHVAAEEDGEDVTFLRRVQPGATDRSYGVHVADLAGVPDPVVSRARTVLARLRADRAIEAKGAGGGETVQAVFDLGRGGFRGSASPDGGDGPDLPPESRAVLEELRTTDVEETPPVELLGRVEEWQRRLDGE